MNDPTPFPAPSRSHGSHHWAFERLLSASLVPLTAAAFVTSGSSYPILDGVLGVSLVMHSHLGVRSVAFEITPTDDITISSTPASSTIFTHENSLSLGGLPHGVFEQRLLPPSSAFTSSTQTISVRDYSCCVFLKQLVYLITLFRSHRAHREGLDRVIV